MIVCIQHLLLHQHLCDRLMLSAGYHKKFIFLIRNPLLVGFIPTQILSGVHFLLFTLSGMRYSGIIYLLKSWQRVFFYICRTIQGLLAQSVQSACFTRMRSLVRIQYSPLKGCSTRMIRRFYANYISRMNNLSRIF